MKIKRILIIVAITILSCLNIVKAQSILEGSRFRLEVGPSLSRVENFTLGGETSNLYSYRAGVTGSIPINFSNFEISTGLIFTQKGEKYETKGRTITFDPTYLVVPVDLSYRIDIDDNGAFFINAGPFFGLGIINDNDKNAFGDSGSLKRMDVGLGISGMVEYNNIIGRIGGEVSLLNPEKETLNDRFPTRIYQIYLTLGYRLFNW